ncbi:hypothetical protein CTAYLR_006129 [Chrysophaeum taylorii]|uniref:Protein-serine/threonine phosphatase n=1 Tax=Chrysophaeum taylorii TaxID=2483200 RepID=A0AAD7UNW7_9STRA|nr:hypothetical protein CTAYLR_006129 [Chrysophaeum taylorii]
MRLSQNTRRTPDIVRRSREQANSRRGSVGLDHIILKLTTLGAEGGRRKGFVVSSRATIGRNAENLISVSSDPTMEPVHAVIERDADSVFSVRAASGTVAVRVSIDEERDSAREWPLLLGASFAAASSVAKVTGVTPRHVEIRFVTGPIAGTTHTVDETGATLGRSLDNTIVVPDGDLSRSHFRIVRVDTTFYLRDLSSTNGTYMRLEGPYAGPCKLRLTDRILVARTGFSINRFDYGIAEEMGVRDAMEDRAAVVQDLLHVARSPCSYVAVFDGHGGSNCAAFLRKQLHLHLADDLAKIHGEWNEVSTKAAMTAAFLRADERFISSSGKPQAGSTAVVALVTTKLLCCANVGDSRAVLCRGGDPIPLSEDHKPSRKDEAARIKAAGGFVIHKRVMGELAVSRAFGDAELKKSISELVGDSAEAPPPPTPASKKKRRLVVAEPDIRVDDLNPADEFVLLATDGLFNVFSDTDAVAFARADLMHHADPQLAAERLANSAIHDRKSRALRHWLMPHA